MMISKEFEAIKANQLFLQDYLQGMSLLHKSGLTRFLRTLGRPIIIENGKDVQVQASQALWSAGFHDCLDCLMNFKEMFLDKEADPVAVRRDFGGTDIALHKGDLTEEETDAIRTGRNPDYSQYIAPARSTTANSPAGGASTSSGKTNS